jgi:hypothetical protein
MPGGDFSPKYVRAANLLRCYSFTAVLQAGELARPLCHIQHSLFSIFSTRIPSSMLGFLVVQPRSLLSAHGIWNDVCSILLDSGRWATR